jgi:hypothetical protein
MPRRRAARDPVVAFAGLDQRGRRLVLYVAHYRRRHGTGPTWRQAASAVGVHDAPERWPLMASVAPCLTWERDAPRSLDIAAELGPVLMSVLEPAKKERTP